ncbi:ABC transporter permease [Niabella ginsengisoli]|uniref:ABC transporter permease n=1 Tax=Niabella ginsengisoli TaxID=522298 RepID=A0ABS9SMM9_9BACT|nr:ABC transporter permease [Niabella ginsengisoli]MCH5599627.1 ABC transporter permease [Niabella ginsengisoli]
MYKLWATIKKDWRILTRDKVGLTLMFVMPIVLAIVITTVQNSTFELVNDKKVPLLLLNKDKGVVGKELEATLQKGGMFTIKKLSAGQGENILKQRLQNKEALLALIIPEQYTSDVLAKSEKVAGQALQSIAVASDTTSIEGKRPVASVVLYYHPVLQSSFRQGIDGALSSVLQIVQSKYIVRQLYSAINDSAAIPNNLEQEILTNQTPVQQFSVSKDGDHVIVNATQHNIPAWTVFAMFFIVISLGASIVREKNSGSFMRLKTMPTSLTLAIISKQITYIIITVIQALIIFSIGKWIFPHIGLPGLDFPNDKASLMLVIILCGWCAASFAIMIGVFAKTQEQSNGIGAVVIVLFAAVGGLLVPAFAMPQSMQGVMRISPLHWCLEAFYGLFLEQGDLKDIFLILVPIIIMIFIFQLIAFIGMKRQRLI